MRKSNTVVWKYALDQPRMVFEMPSGARVLSVDVQGSDIVLWAEVNPAATTHDRRTFNAINTGAQLPPDRVAFVGTVQVEGVEYTPIVWHVYEVEQ